MANNVFVLKLFLFCSDVVELVASVLPIIAVEEIFDFLAVINFILKLSITS